MRHELATMTLTGLSAEFLRQTSGKIDAVDVDHDADSVFRHRSTAVSRGNPASNSQASSPSPTESCGVCPHPAREHQEESALPAVQAQAGDPQPGLHSSEPIRIRTRVQLRVAEET